MAEAVARRVVPAQAGGQFRGEGVRHVVEHIRVVPLSLEAMREARGHVDPAAGVFIEFHAQIPEERGGPCANVDDDVDERTARASNELALAARGFLEVQAASRSGSRVSRY